MSDGIKKYPISVGMDIPEGVALNEVVGEWGAALVVVHSAPTRDCEPGVILSVLDKERVAKLAIPLAPAQVMSLLRQLQYCVDLHPEYYHSN